MLHPGLRIEARPVPRGTTLSKRLEHPHRDARPYPGTRAVREKNTHAPGVRCAQALPPLRSSFPPAMFGQTAGCLSYAPADGDSDISGGIVATRVPQAFHRRQFIIDQYLQGPHAGHDLCICQCSLQLQPHRNICNICDLLACAGQLQRRAE